MSESGHGLAPGEVEALCRLADHLIPDSERMPAASRVDGGADWLRHALAVRPDLIPAVRRVVTRTSAGDPGPVVADLRQNDSELFLSLATVVAGAYYMNPVIRKLIGYPGQEPMFAGSASAEDGLGDDLLGCVLSRGARYRETPDLKAE
jgi:hypothetical protein